MFQGTVNYAMTNFLHSPCNSLFTDMQSSESIYSELEGGSLGANYIIVCLITLTLDLITHCRMIEYLTLSRKLRTMEGKEIKSSVGINDGRAKI